MVLNTLPLRTGVTPSLSALVATETILTDPKYGLKPSSYTTGHLQSLKTEHFQNHTTHSGLGLAPPLDMNID